MRAYLLLDPILLCLPGTKLNFVLNCTLRVLLSLFQDLESEGLGLSPDSTTYHQVAFGKLVNPSVPQFPHLTVSASQGSCED